MHIMKRVSPPKIPSVQSPATTATTLHHQQMHQSSSQWPSYEQQQGIAALYALNDSEIFDYLTALRSLKANLTNKQLIALESLSSAPDDHIKTWLDFDRRVSSSVQSERSSLVGNVSDNRISAASWSTDNTSRSCLSSFSQGTPAIENLKSKETAQGSAARHEAKIPLDLNKSLPQEPLDLHKTLPQEPKDGTGVLQESHFSKHGSRHRRWCTTREHPNVFSTHRGFAKHENEHDNSYLFLPQGPIEETRWGPQCALCETTNPDKAHLQSHDILKYEGWLSEPIKRSRKANFEELLKKHKASHAKYKILPEKWRVIGSKKAYSCGFCISIFEKLSDRTRHIDREHYAKGWHIDDWNDTYVIKGLLLQQDLKQECLKLFQGDPTVMEARISWPPAVIKDLQLRLELREESAKDLAVQVFNQANRRAMLPSSRSNGTPFLFHRSDVMGCIQTSSSAPVRTSFQKGSAANALQISNQDQNNESSDGLQIESHAYSSDLNTMEFSHMSVSSPPSNSQLWKISSGFPVRSDSLAAGTNGNTRLMHPLVSHNYHNALSSSDWDNEGVDLSDSLDPSYTARPESDFDLVSSFNASTSEVASRAAPHLDFLEDNVSENSPDPSSTTQAPKRKLSDKSAKEANLKAQTQPPMSIHNQQHRLHRSSRGMSNAQANVDFDLSY